MVAVLLPALEQHLYFRYESLVSHTHRAVFHQSFPCTVEHGLGQTGFKHWKRVMPCRIINVEHFTAMLCPLVSTRAQGHLMPEHLPQEHLTLDAKRNSKWLFCAFIIAKHTTKGHRLSLLGTMRHAHSLSCSCVILRSCLYRPQVPVPALYRYLMPANAEIVDQQFLAAVQWSLMTRTSYAQGLPARRVSKA